MFFDCKDDFTLLPRWSKFFSIALLVTLINLLWPVTVTAQNNPIIIENNLPGDPDWNITNPSDDTIRHIKGYASATSVDQGESITFYVTVNPIQTYTIDIYRMGWYGGDGARLLQSIGPVNGITQPDPIINANTGMVTVDWAASHTLTIPQDWVSGVYIAKLVNQTGRQNHIIFVVRDDNRTADFLYQQPVTTYQAYNNFPNDGVEGKSLYDFNSYGANTLTGSKRAVKVSYDRPYADYGSSLFFAWEYDFIRWVERQGYDISYSTNIDTHSAGNRLLNYKAFLSVGHDEYWSKAMYDAAENARDAGVHLGFFGANNVYWQIRLQASGGAPNRIIACYKDGQLDPITTASLKTTLWRDPNAANRPEQELLGIQFGELNDFSFDGSKNSDYVITNSHHWAYAGSGFINGDSVANIVGYEVDRQHPNTPLPTGSGYTLLSASPFLNSDNQTVTVHSSIYLAPSNTWVFSAGSLSWTWALENPAFENSGIQRTASNVLDRFIHADKVANMLTPVPNSTLDDTEVTFTWDNISNAQYWLEIGTSPGAGDIYGGDQGSNDSTTIADLPSNGGEIYLRLWSIVDNNWRYNDYQYTAVTGNNSGPAQITSPVPDSTLSGDTVEFTWDDLGGNTEYWLEIGATAGGAELYGQSSTTTETSTTATGLPTDGSTIYARLWTINGFTWESQDFQYTAATSGNSGPAQITTPVPDSTLPGSSIEFTWDDLGGSTEYWLEIGSSQGNADYYGQSDTTTDTSATATGLPTDGSTI